MRKSFIAILLFTAFANLFFFHSIGSLGAALILAGIYGLIAITIVQQPFKREWLYISGLFAFTLSLILTKTNDVTVGISLLTALGLLAVQAYLFASDLPFVRSWYEVLRIPLHLLNATLQSFLQSTEHLPFKSLSLGKHITVQSKTIGSIFKGVIFAIPILFFLLLLLVSADPIYGNAVQQLFKLQIDVDTQLIQRILLSAVILVLCLPFVRFVRIRHSQTELLPAYKLGYGTETVTVLVLVALLLLSFLLVQFQYIFLNVAKETSLVQFGVQTYSEYVRRGFFELVFAGFIVFGTVVAAQFATRNMHEDGKLTPAKIAQLVVLGELGIFIFSLFRRIWLYQYFHGWSLSRIYGGMFLLLLTVFAVTLALRQFYKKNWLMIESVAVAALFLVFGLFNAEHFIATSGHPPTVNERIDYVYLSRLSPDGYAGWKMAYTHAQEVLVDRKYEDHTIIDANGRRDIYYAGRIVNELAWNYAKLVLHHGSDQEIRDFLTLLLQQEKNGEKVSNEDTQLYDKTIALLADPKTEKIPFLVYNHAKDIAFYSSEQKRSALPVGLYYFPKNSNYTYFDTQYSWNSTAMSVLGNMRQDIPFEKLIELQQRFNMLSVKISQQPEDQRDFHIDVSFQSPFID